MMLTARCKPMPNLRHALCLAAPWKLCVRDKLLSNDQRKAGKKIMLAAGIKQLRDKKIIDARLFDWSQELHAFRNLAAHPDEGSISREDAEDLQAFAYAIIEYIYDLTERYEEFNSRTGLQKKKKQ